MQLGLSHRQARVYLALLISGASTAKAISKVSKVSRQDVYTVVSVLERMGLCDKTITKPAIFRATPLQKGLGLLMQRRSIEYREMRNKTRNLQEELRHYNKGTVYQEDKTEFVLLPERQERVLRIEEAIYHASTNVDSFTTQEIFKQVISSSKEVLKKTLKRGIPFRFLMQELKNKDLKPEIPDVILNNPLLEIRYVRMPVPAAVVMIDKKEIFFGTTIDFQRATYLWSNNSHLVGIIQDHFDSIWGTPKSE